MEHQSIDFLKQKYELKKPDERPFLFFRRGILIAVVLLAITGAVFSFQVKSTSEGVPSSANISLFSIIKNFLLPENDLLNGEREDRINFLLTGVGGDGHQGGQLTDTIVFASYRPSTKSIGLLSLPRDMSVQIEGKGYQKVNHVNAYAEAEQRGSGAPATADFLSKLLKQPIHYYLRVDFHAFEEVIDTIGGVDVVVDTAFTDPAYPIPGKEMDTCGNSEASMNATAEELADTSAGPAIPPANYSCRFKVLSFQKGEVHMDGATALAFARSRHGNNGEGSDFARARRQQKIMVAVKDKVFSASTFLNPVRVTGILDALDRNISTNLSVSQMMQLGKELKDLQSTDISSRVIDDAPGSPLYSSIVNGAYVLLPKNNNWTVIEQMAQYMFTQDPDQKPLVSSQTNPASTTPAATTSRVEIQNGTTITGLATRASQLLATKSGLRIATVGNATERGFIQTTIVDLTNGTKKDALKTLQETLKTTAITQSLPGAIAATGSSIDFLVILGQDAENLVR